MLFWALYMLPPICPFLSYLQARVHWWWHCPMSLSCWRSVHTVCPSTPAFHIGIDYFLWWLLHCKRHKEEGGLKGQITVSEYPGSVQVNCRLLRFLIKDDIIFSNSMVIQPGDCHFRGIGWSMSYISLLACVLAKCPLLTNTNAWY